MVDFRNGASTQNNNKTAPSTPKMMIKGGAIIGEVTAKDDKSIAVKMSDGSSKIVIISDKTIYRISDEANLEKIIVGTKVATYDEANGDGTTTATNIEINPVVRELIQK